MNKSTRNLHIDGYGGSEYIVPILDAAEKPESVDCYENEIPDFVEAELERLYGSLFSSLPYLKIHGKLTRLTSTCVIRNGDEINAIFLFQHHGRLVKVINEGMKICVEELRFFSNYIFSKYKSVNFISFDGVEPQSAEIPFPHQRLGCSCDLVLDLPATEDLYLASLGKHLRHSIRRALTRLPAEHPTFRIDFYDAAEVEEIHVRDIIDLNRTRMDSMKNVYKRDHDEVQKVIDLCKSRGLVGVMTIEGKVCGGSVGYRVGDNHIGRIISHDAKYDKYSLGTICIFLCIRECIARGYRQFNFMSGNNDYKTALGGVPRNLDKFLIYRSRAQLMLNPDIATRMLSEKLVHHARLKVQRKLSALRKLKSQGKLDTRSELLFFGLDKLRSLKDHVSGMSKRR